MRSASGAGFQQQLNFLYPCVKQWFEGMRNAGHWVDKSDLVMELHRRCEIYLPKMKAKAENEKLTVLELSRVDIVTKRMKSFQIEHGRDYLVRQLQKYLGARLWKPQRLVSLTFEQERGRTEATWMHYDDCLWNLATCDRSFLDRRCAVPEQMIENMSDAVLLFSDQIPIWLKIVCAYRLYGKDECNDQKSGTGQMRAFGRSEQDKFRVTSEACQAVFDYFRRLKSIRMIRKSREVLLRSPVWY